VLRPVAVLLRQHWRRLRAQPVRTALAVLAVAAGTALGMGVVIVVSSATSSLDALGQAVAGPAPLRVVGAVADGGIPDRLVGQVRRVPQVAGVLPVVQVASVVRTADGGHLGVVVLGVGCGPSEPTATGPCPAGTTAPAVGGALAAQLGPASWLQTDQGVLPLGSVSVRPALASVAGGRVVVLGLADAQRLYDEQRRVDVVYVALRAGASVPAVQQQLERRVGPAFAVLTADQPPPALTLATSSFVPLLALVAVLAAGIAAVLVYDVVALSLEEHRREQAVLAAVGAAPGVVAAGPLLDVGLLGLLGGLLGVAGGAAVARPILAPLSAFTEAIFGVPLAVHVDPTDVLLGVGFGLAVGLAAVVRPTRRLATMDVAGELAGRARRVEASAATVGRRGLVAAGALGVGLVLVFVGSRHGALAGWQLPVAEVGFLLAVAAGAGVVGAGAALALRCTRARPRRRRFRAQDRSGRLPPALSLGVVSLGREPGRVAVIAVAVAAAVAVGTVTSGYTAGLAAQVSTSVRASAAGRGVVVDTVAGTSGDNPGAHVPAAAVREIARVPGVGQVDEDVSVLSGSSPASLVLVTAAASPAGGSALVAGRATVGPFRRGAVLVGTGLARARGLRPGGRLALDTPGGRVRVPVEGIWNDGAVNGDNVTMDAAELERLFGPQLPLSLTVVPAPGTTTAELLARLRTLPLPPDVTLAAPTSYRHQQVAQLTGQLSPFDTLEQALLVVAFVGVLATLLLMAAGQRRQMALGQAIGLTPADVAATVVAGAVAAAGAGAAGGVVLGAVVLRGLLWLVPLVVGVTVPYRFPLAVLVTLAPLAVAVAGAAAALPAVQAVRAPVVDELRRD
jgi:putative ABC transport system permease protein